MVLGPNDFDQDSNFEARFFFLHISKQQHQHTRQSFHRVHPLQQPSTHHGPCRLPQPLSPSSLPPYRSPALSPRLPSRSARQHAQGPGTSSVQALAPGPLAPPAPRALPTPLSSPATQHAQGRVRTKTVKRSARTIVERYYPKLTLDFDTNKRVRTAAGVVALVVGGTAAGLPFNALSALRHTPSPPTQIPAQVTDEVAICPSKRMRNKIAGFITVRGDAGRGSCVTGAVVQYEAVS